MAGIVDHIIDFFHTMLVHRRTIRDLQAENSRLLSRTGELTDGVRLLGNALAYRIQQDTEPATDAVKPFVVRRKGWQEITYGYEVNHNQTLRMKIEAAKQRHAAFDR